MFFFCFFLISARSLDSKAVAGKRDETRSKAQSDFFKHLESVGNDFDKLLTHRNNQETQKIVAAFVSAYRVVIVNQATLERAALLCVDSDVFKAALGNLTLQYSIKENDEQMAADANMGGTTNMVCLFLSFSSRRARLNVHGSV